MVNTVRMRGEPARAYSNCRALKQPEDKRTIQMKRIFFVHPVILSAILVSGAFSQTAQRKAPAAPAKPLACIIDLDGTVADESERREAAAGEDGKLGGKEWEAYFDPSKVPGDRPLPTGLETLKWLDGRGIIIFYVSSRPATMLEASRKWIGDNGFPAGKDVHHKKEKYEKSLKYKTRVIEEIKGDGYDVIFGVGDRDKDIQSYKTFNSSLLGAPVSTGYEAPRTAGIRIGVGI